mgnify:CR=1 FL=1
MGVMIFLSDIMIPLLIFGIVGYGILNRQNIYEEFIDGAKDGFQTVIGIMPTLIGLMVAVGILRLCSGASCRILCPLVCPCRAEAGQLQSASCL